MKPFDYLVHRIGPSILGGSVVGCIIVGEVNTVHALLIALGAVTVALGWWRVGRHGTP